ncbi:thioredoxin domain-containing protein, partial [Candidatus Gracilibacteria bacterium]|nr:thioredoxin domain-containing protein [Candidatus Gracilibacteria bacterium]
DVGGRIVGDGVVAHMRGGIVLLAELPVVLADIPAAVGLLAGRADFRGIGPGPVLGVRGDEEAPHAIAHLDRGQLKLYNGSFDTFVRVRSEHAAQQAALDEEIALAESLGVNSTPNFFINGTLIRGALPFSTFQRAIDEAIAATP